MADHRVTDLALGHPGKATYDSEEQEWKFSQTLTDSVSIKQLLPFEEWAPPSDHIPSKRDEKTSVVIQNQTRWLSRTLPETFPARSITANLVRGSWEASSEIPSDLGCLLAIGQAHDPERVSGIRRPQIIAVSCGAAGHVLRLIKPRVETRGWGKSSGARLSLLNVDSLDAGHWIGTGGTIRQIVASESENDKECWLAVRQATVVTLFRPIYGKIHPHAVPTGYSPFPPSMMNANPRVSLTAQKTGSKDHSDVAFNPWFSRQIAVVDTLGYWSVWEVDARYDHSKNASETLVPKKTGGFYDCWAKDEPQTPEHGHFDGWYRILWASNLSTIVVCNRRYITVFDIKAQSTLLSRVDLFSAGNTDWILDIQRSTSDKHYLHVLTTTRIFWLEIIPTGERNDDHVEAGGRIVLSYFHFMSPDDESLKLTPLKSDKVSVAIVSAKNRVVTYYAFRKPHPQAHASSKGTFSLHLSSDQNGGRNLPIHSVKFLPCRLMLSANHFFGPGSKYVENGVEFFQLWAVTADLGLLSTLFTVTLHDTKTPAIIAPDTKLLLSSRFLGPKFVNEDDDFVVPDEHKHPNTSPKNRASHANHTPVHAPDNDDLRFRVNWRRIFQIVFPEKLAEEELSSRNLDLEPAPTFLELLSLTTDDIMQRKELDEPMSATLAEMIGAPRQGEDLQQASLALHTFLKSLQLDQDPEDRWRLAVRDLTWGTGINLLQNEGSMYPDLLAIFDQLVEYWMTSLPMDVPNLVRHAKFKVIRQLTMDLCLNSIGIFLQDKALDHIADTASRDDESGAVSLGKDGRFTTQSSPRLFSSQTVATQYDPGLTLPTPTQTPSLYSQATSASGLAEDPVIARLRQYAPSIKAKAELGANSNASVLCHWPSALADPAEYSYETAKKAWASANTEEDDARSSRKVKARRRRRTEEFVKAVEPAVSRRLTLTAGSQPEVIEKMFSSQPASDVPMTQPDRGAFGSRSVQQVKKKAKKARTAGFK
ncbi:RNA polymerase I-specific transcription initiation factor RRN6-like protein [Cadophora sp. MPI-SDFR-AT-0126]|nr:RNA polymerase I-specific transcription initiation factor RRN6-like protein [Leotiomycetes sp. MPI-SDFR-AT-0126]